MILVWAYNIFVRCSSFNLFHDSQWIIFSLYRAFVVVYDIRLQYD